MALRRNFCVDFPNVLIAVGRLIHHLSDKSWGVTSECLSLLTKLGGALTSMFVSNFMDVFSHAFFGEGFSFEGSMIVLLELIFTSWGETRTWEISLLFIAPKFDIVRGL